MAWIYLIIAAIFETAWTYSLKYLKFSDFKLITISNFYTWNPGVTVISPLIGYILFGIANVFFFSLAIKELSVATAYAAWTAITLILLKLTDALFFHKSTSWQEIVFMLLIMTGILGLKFYTTTQ